MIIRTDFVTNSSGSSFVTVTFNLKNNEKAECDFEEHQWYEYHMPDYCEGRPIFETSKPCTESNNISSLAELLMRIIECTESELSIEGYLPENIDYPEELFPLFVEMYRDEAKAKDLYEDMNQKYTWFKDVYQEYDEGFIQWVKDTFLSYPLDDLLESTKDIKSLSDIKSISVKYIDQNWGSCLEPEMMEDDSDDVAEKEEEFYYDFHNEDDEQAESPAFENKTAEVTFRDKKVVTTGLSAADERWVQEQVESRGGEYKPKFVVSLDYLIYNPDYDHETVKYTRAKEQIDKGKDVKIITLDEFKDLIK